MSKKILPSLSVVRRALLLLPVLIAGIFSCMSVISPSQSAVAATNSTINFQARLLTASGSTVADGQYNVEFKVYNAASSSGSSQGSCSGDSACLWAETRTTSNKVRVANGYLTVNLGSVTAFGSTINWDQEMWLTMNIGGTGSPGWDGEMTPRLKLTAVPYAFRAGQLANTNGANQSTLGWATQSTSNSILLPNEGGTLCIQSSSNCGFLTSATADSNYVKLQGSTPGTPQTGNLNISGTGVFGTALQAPIFDRASAGALQIGTTNATSISLQQDTTLASGKTLTLQGGFAMTPSADTTSVFNVRTSGGNNMFTIDTQNARVGIGLGSSTIPTLQDAGVEIRGSIRLSGADGTYTDAYITPKVGGGSVNSLINIVNYNPGQYGQLIAMGLPSNAHLDSRAFSLFDARASAHQPTLAVFSPDQNQLGGFSWDGSDATFLTKTSTNNMALQAGGLNVMTLQNVSSVARVGIGNGSPSYPLDVTGDINSTTALRVGGNVVCTSSGCSASSTLQNAYDAGNTITTTSARNMTITLADTATDSNFSVNMQCTTCSTDGGRFEVQNAGTAAFWLNPGSAAGQRGSAVFRNTANDVNAFQIQTSGGGSTVFNVDTSNGRVGINNAAPTVALDVGPASLGTSEVVQIRIGDFLLQSQQGAANGLAALTSRGSNGNLTLDGASGAGLYLSPFTTNNNFLAAGGGSVRVGSTSAPTYKLDVTGDINTSSAIRVSGTVVCDATGTTGCVAKSGSGYYIHNDTAVQAANIYVQAATTGSVAAKFQAFNGGSGDIANFLNGTGTTVGSISSVGAVLFKPSTNSASAFQIQPSGSSTPVLNVDTTDGRVGIGTNTPSRTVHAVVSNTQTTAPMAMLEQTSTGDVSLEFKSPSKSYIVGQDASDGGKFKISSSTASSSPGSFGKTTIGASEDSGDNNTMECAKFVTGGSAATAASMTVYERGAVDTGSNNQWQGAIYSDNGAGTSPVNLISSSADATLTANSWNTVNLTASLSASTTYWLCANTNGTDPGLNNWAYDTVSNSAVWKSRTYGTWPADFTLGGGIATVGTQFSFYVTYTPTGSYDSFTKSLMALGETGQTTFQNSADSTAAFQIQNAAGTSMLIVDTSNTYIQLGSSTTDATAIELILDSYNQSTDPTGTNGAMYYNSNLGKFRCYQAGVWMDCIGSLTSANTAAGTAVNTCTTCAAFNTSAAIPANYCQAGRTIRILARGVYSTAATTTPTLALGVYYGTDAANRANDVQIGTSIPTTPTLANSLASRAWSLDFTIICFSTTVMNGQGYWIYSNSATNNATNIVTSAPATSNTTVVSTSNKNLYLFPTWGASNAGNTITVQQFIVLAQ